MTRPLAQLEIALDDRELTLAHPQGEVGVRHLALEREQHGLIRREARFGARVGYWTSPAVHSQATGTEVRFDALSVRPSVAVRFAMLELGAGPVLAPFWVRGGEGHRDMLAGASVQLALWLAVVGALRLTARAQLDVLGNRTRLYAGDDPVVTTPRFMLGLSLGFAWGWS